MYCDGVKLPRPKSVKTLTNLPNIKSMKGSAVPLAMAATHERA